MGGKRVSTSHLRPWYSENDVVPPLGFEQVVVPGERVLSGSSLVITEDEMEREID